MGTTLWKLAKVKINPEYVRICHLAYEGKRFFQPEYVRPPASSIKKLSTRLESYPHAGQF